MKRTFMTIVSIMAISLAACGTTKEEPTSGEGASPTPPVEQPEQNEAPEQPADTTNGDTAAGDSGQTDSRSDSMKADMDKLSFKEIEIEISYGRDTEYEAEIEQDKNEPIKAKVEDEVNQVYLKGQEAFDDLYPKVQKLQLTKDSTKEETIDQVLKAFDLKFDYVKFEVEINFNDGSELDIEDRK